MTTKEIEHIMYKQFSKTGLYSVFECSAPRSYIDKYHRERVDYVSYETNGIFRFMEIKISKSDFYSNCKWTFLGHYNYFVMPIDLYYKVKQDIPDYVGCWAVYEDERHKWLECVKKPKKQELKVNADDMRMSILQALSREYKKYRKILEKENIKKKKIKKNS